MLIFIQITLHVLIAVKYMQVGENLITLDNLAIAYIMSLLIISKLNLVHI